jgi:hypothetical protein
MEGDDKDSPYVRKLDSKPDDKSRSGDSGSRRRKRTKREPVEEDTKPQNTDEHAQVCTYGEALLSSSYCRARVALTERFLMNL